MEEAATPPGLSVVIVNWNGAAYLDACLASVEGRDHEVIVVDNGSRDGSAGVVARHPGTRWIANPDNRGFAVAANQGLHAAHGRNVLFLNPDARANDEAIEAAQKLLDAHPEVGLVGVAVRDPSGARIPTVEPFFTFGALLRARAESRALAPSGAGPVPVDWMHGVFLASRRDDLTAIGGFDEQFFLYAEDMDLCFRVHASGRAVVYLPTVSVEHDGNRAGRVLLGETRPAAGFASALRFYAKHHSTFARVALRLAATGAFSARALGYSLMRSPRSTRYWALAAVAAGVEDLILPPALRSTRR